jgi:hypothetical protein
MYPSVHRHQEMGRKSTTLSNFHIKAHGSDNLMPFDQYESLLMNMPSLQRFECTISVRIEENNQCNLDYVNGKHWDRIRRQLHHLVDFDCSISCYFGSLVLTNSICEKVLASFSSFSDWHINIHYGRLDYIHASRRSQPSPLVPSLRRSRFNVDCLNYLRRTDGSQIIADLKHITTLNINCESDDDDEDDEEDYSNDPSSLILPDRCLPYLHNLSVGAQYRADFGDPFLQTFLQQLFRRAPNLISIEMTNDDDDQELLKTIVDFLRSFPEPLTQVEEYEIRCGICVWDETLISDIAFYLPSLTIFILDELYFGGDKVDEIANLCITHIRHLMYLEIRWDVVMLCGQNDITDIHSWLKRYTVLGSSMSEKVFEAELGAGTLKIWL